MSSMSPSSSMSATPSMIVTPSMSVTPFNHHRINHHNTCACVIVLFHNKVNSQ